MALALLTLAAGCSSDGQSEPAFAYSLDGGGSTVVVSTSIWADVVGNLLCEPAGTIRPLVAPGSDPHGFQPTLAQASAVQEADLVIANGSGLEGAMTELLRDRSDAGGMIIYASDLTTTQNGNPHIWLDPTKVIEVARALDPILVKFGADEAASDSCTAAYVAQLTALDNEISDLFDNVADDDRKIVTNHEVLDYFSKRYEIEIVGTAISSSSSLAEANPSDLEQLKELIIANNVRAVVAEGDHSSSTMESLLSELEDVELLALDLESLGEPGTDSDTYVELMRSTATHIAAALGANS